MFEGVVSEFETEGISAGSEAVMMPEVGVSYHWFREIVFAIRYARNTAIIWLVVSRNVY